MSPDPVFVDPLTKNEGILYLSVFAQICIKKKHLKKCVVTVVQLLVGRLSVLSRVTSEEVCFSSSE
jgi:hypothetical protein